MMYRLIVLVGLACGGATSNVESPPPPPEQVEPARAPIVGRWHGSISGGIGASSDWTFTDDGSYEMEGYPSIGERGRWSSTAGASEGSWTLRFTERQRCGPCENAGPNEPAEDVERAIEVSPDGTTFTLDGWSLSRQ
jgi:hypothetical protein